MEGVHLHPKPLQFVHGLGTLAAILQRLDVVCNARQRHVFGQVQIGLRQYHPLHPIAFGLLADGLDIPPGHPRGPPREVRQRVVGQVPGVVLHNLPPVLLGRQWELDHDVEAAQQRLWTRWGTKRWVLCEAKTMPLLSGWWILYQGPQKVRCGPATLAPAAPASRPSLPSQFH